VARATPWLALLLNALAVDVQGQERESFGAFGISVGRHGVGIGIEMQLAAETTTIPPAKHAPIVTKRIRFRRLLDRP
jgi:hypothetical protein